MDDETREYFKRVIDVVSDRADASDQRMDSFEQKFEKSHNDVVTILDSVVKELGDLHTEYHLISAALARLDDSSRSTHGEVSELRSRLDSFEERLNRLEAGTRRDHDA